MKKLLALLLGMLLLPLSGFAAITHFTETLPPAATQGCMPVSNGYDWGLTCDSTAQPMTLNGSNQGPSIFTVQNQLAVSSFTTITPTSKYINVGSTGTNINMAGAGSNNLPVIATATATAGQEIVLISTQATATITLASGTASGLDLGSATRVLANGKVLGLYFNNTSKMWVEMFFGNN